LEEEDVIGYDGDEMKDSMKSNKQYIKDDRSKYIANMIKYNDANIKSFTHKKAK